MSTASAVGLAVDDAVVLNDSNRLVVRLTPCDIVARVTPMTHHAGHHMSAEREVELVNRLAQTGSPVAALDARIEPRVFVHDGFKISMWAYFEPAKSRMLPPAGYAQALERLHAGLRQIDFTSPHVMDRVAAVQQDVASRDVTPKTHASSTPALVLTAAQRAIYQLSSAGAAAPRPIGRYVELTEKDNSGGQRSQVTTIFNGQTGETWTYQEGAGIPRTFAPQKHSSLTEAQFDALPTGTAALRAYLIKQAKEQAAAALIAEEQQLGKGSASLPPQPTESDDDMVFDQAANMLWNPLVGPALRAALYNALATTPGVQVNPNARDLQGRPVIEISRPDYTVGEVVATFEDPGNGSVLESLWDYPANMGVGTVPYSISGLYLSLTSSNTLPRDPYRN